MFVRWARRAGAEERSTGQGLVEFALVIPLVLVLFMGLVEIALAFNATIGVNRASQNGAHLAAIMGNTPGADCLILKEIEEDVHVPNDKSKIQEVIIERTALVGNASYAQQTWTRITPPPPDCTLPDGTTATVPYVLTANTNGHPQYPEDQRCPVLKGCDAPYDPVRSTVDNIGVSIRYRHIWATPLSTAFDFLGSFFNVGGNVGWTIVQRNIFRIEPTL